mgnify:CR=1 FL=1
MSKLDELIAELCPDGVEYIPLGEVLKNNNAPNSISKKYYKESGDIPIIDQSQVYIAGYTDDESAVPPILPCIIFGDHTRVVKYADRKFAQGDSGTKVFIPVTEDLNTKYIYYAFCNIDITSRGYNRHWTIAKNIKIPLPPLPVQREIVRILDNFTELTAKLTAELTVELAARRKQHEYYRDLLLTFGDDIEILRLEEVADIYDSLHQTPAYLNEGFSMIRVTDVKGGYIDTTSTLKVDYETYLKFTQKYKPQYNDIVVSRVGSYGNFSLIGESQNCCLGQNTAIIHPRILSKFLYYYLCSKYVKTYIENNINGGSQKTFSLKNIKSII